MKTNIFAPFWTILVLFCLTAVPLKAEQLGLFSYEAVDGAVTIKGYPRDAVGDVDIPCVIYGKSVTSIGVNSFYDCRLHDRLASSVAVPSPQRKNGIPDHIIVSLVILD